MIMIVESNSNSLNIYPLNEEQQTLEDEVQRAIEEACLTITSCSIRVPKTTISILRTLSLRPWQNLESLGLSSNNISSIGCKAISKGRWQHLHTLMLDNNSIQAIGINHLMKSQMPALAELWLMGNKIGSGGVQEVSKLNNRLLTTLYLDRNQMSLDELFRMFLTDFAQMKYCYIQQNRFQPTDQLSSLACRKFIYLQEFYTM